MRFAIAPRDKHYRGMERLLTTSHLWNLKGKNSFVDLLEMYFLYLEHCEDANKTSFERTLAYCKEFCAQGIFCETIVYDSTPIETVYGYQIELLGIDIVHDMCESLISDDVHPIIQHLLNENGLCKTVDDVERIIPFQDYGNVIWEPCYIYTVKLDA